MYWWRDGGTVRRFTVGEVHRRRDGGTVRRFTVGEVVRDGWIGSPFRRLCVTPVKNLKNDSECVDRVDNWLFRPD